jgi:hypothetical protein
MFSASERVNALRVHCKSSKRERARARPAEGRFRQVFQRNITTASLEAQAAVAASRMMTRQESAALVILAAGFPATADALSPASAFH